MAQISPVSTGPPKRRSVLVIIEGGGGEHLSGPEIRGWEMARALGKRLGVSVASEDPAGTMADPATRIVPRGRARLVREVARHDAVLAPWVPAYLLAGLARRHTLAVADLYDPVQIESASLGESADRQFIETARRARIMQLRFADVLMCASEPQRREIETELAALPVAGDAPDVIIVPFGIGADTPDPRRRPLRQGFPEIGPEDPVVLWWGSIWRWMDAETAIHAAARAAERCPGMRLVFSAGRPPRDHVGPHGAAEEARSLAKSLGLLDRVVFFIDDWIPYAERHEYLLDADVGLNLHRHPDEAKLSARARSMDFLWARLPCVLTDGTVLGEQFATAGFARQVPIADVEGVSAALLALVEDADARGRARSAAEELVPRYRWEAVTEPLAERLADQDGPSPVRQVSRLGAASGALGYYSQRLRQLTSSRLDDLGIGSSR